MLILLQDNTIYWFSIQKLNSDDLKSYNVSNHWYNVIKEFWFDPKNRQITVDHHHLEFQRSAINHIALVTASCWSFYLLFFVSMVNTNVIVTIVVYCYSDYDFIFQIWTVFYWIDPLDWIIVIVFLWFWYYSCSPKFNYTIL